MAMTQELQAVEDRAGRRSVVSRLRGSTSIAMQVIVAVVIYFVGSVVVPGFGSPTSLGAMTVLASFLGIAAMGQTLVVLIGGIDLSIPALIGAGNVMAAKLTGEGVPSPVMIMAVLAVGVLAGCLNGFVSQRWGVPPLVVTLATASVVGGLVLLWTNAQLTGSAPQWLTLATAPTSRVGPIPLAPVVFVWLGLAAACAIFLRWTKLGRQIYAIGVNRPAARLMLVSERKISLVVFGLSGLLASVSGLLLAGFTGAGVYNVGDPYLFLAIAAVVIGGTSLLGGRGGPLRTVIGSIVLIELTTLLVGFHLESAAQQAMLGVVIVLVVAIYGRERRIGDRI
jgi:ribose transport system permease protein